MWLRCRIRGLIEEEDGKGVGICIGIGDKTFLGFANNPCE